MMGPPMELCGNDGGIDVGVMQHSAALYYSTDASLCTQLLAAVFVNGTSVSSWQGHTLTANKNVTNLMGHI